MNACTFSGYVAGDCELRTIESGRELLNFDISVDGTSGRDPIVRCAYFPRGNGDVRELKAGCRVMVMGELRHRRDYGLFLAVREVLLVHGA